MRRLLIAMLLTFVGVAAWRIGGRLSPDALGMAIGVVFGVLASLPVALLVLAASRRREQDEYGTLRRRRPAGEDRHARYAPPQPPVILVTGPAMPAQGQPYHQQPYRQLPAPDELEPAQRQFRIVGEKDEWAEWE